MARRRVARSWARGEPVTPVLVLVMAPNEKASPSWKRASMAVTLSDILPKRRERAPEELLPAMPPKVQRLAVEGSTGKKRPSDSETRVELFEDEAGADGCGLGVADRRRGRR